MTSIKIFYSLSIHKKKVISKRMLPMSLLLAGESLTSFVTESKQPRLTITTQNNTSSLFFRYELLNSYFVQDLFLYSSYLYYNFSCFLKFTNLSLLTRYNVTRCNTLSCIYSSFVWLERELSEFNNFFFSGLTDSRRLLTDYLNNNSTFCEGNYKTTHYNTLIQEII